MQEWVITSFSCLEHPLLAALTREHHTSSDQLHDKNLPGNIYHGHDSIDPPCSDASHDGMGGKLDLRRDRYLYPHQDHRSQNHSWDHQSRIDRVCDTPRETCVHEGCGDNDPYSASREA